MRRVPIVLAGVLFVVASPTARAHHHPNSYCSEDICQSTTKVDGIRKLTVRMAAKYFDEYRLCVIPTDGARTCKTFEIHKQGGNYGDAVGWRKHFPDEGKGAYTVVWKMTNGDRFGEKLGFHS